MSNERSIEDLVAAYAVDAVSIDERAEVEEALRLDPGLTRQLEEHRQVAAALAASTLPSHLPEPPAELWTRIRQSLPENEVMQVTKLEPRRTWISRAVAGLAIAAAVAIGVVFSQAVLESDPSIDQAAAAARDASTSELVTLEGDITAQVVLSADGVGYIFAGDLPPLPSDRTYQLWAIVDDQVISAGILGNRPGTAPFNVDAQLSGLALTEEDAGGVISSSNDAVALWVQG